MPFKPINAASNKMSREHDGVRQFRQPGTVADLPPYLAIADLLRGDFKWQAPSVYVIRSVDGKRKCKKCRRSFPKTEMQQLGSAVDYVFCGNCAPAIIEKQKRRKGRGKGKNV